MTPQYNTEFVSSEEYQGYVNTSKQTIILPHNNYLMIEPTKEVGIMLKVKLLYRHPSLYSLKLGDWTYLAQNDLRTIVPFIEYKEKNKPFYIRYGMKFFEVRNIVTNKENILELILQEVNSYSLN
jgi:hypothetical protein